MSRPPILVTGATGKTGAAVVAQLRAQDWPVRAVVRRRDARSARLERLGADMVVADLHDHDQVLGAMGGMTRAYFCPPVEPFMLQAAVVFATAARAVGLERVAQMSQWLASPAHPSLHTRQLWLVERLFAAVPGLAHTVINPGAFADSVLQVTPAAANLGTLPNVFGDLRNAPPSTDDMARVIVAVLTAPTPHAGRRYRPTGPAVVSMADVAAAVGRATGRPVTLQDLPPTMFLKAARVAGASPFEITNVRHYLADGRRGTFAVNAPTAGLEALTGRAPEDLDAIARHYAAQPAARRSAANRLRQVATLVRTLLARPFDADRFDARQLYPVPPAPQLAAESARWHREHATQRGPSTERSDALPTPAR